MKKLVYSALALTLTSVPALATENGWSGLDKEIESLSSSLEHGNPGAPTIGGWVLVSYRHSEDLTVDPDFDGDGDPTTGVTEDQSGFQLDSIRLEVEGDAGDDYSYRISFDLSGGNGPLHGESTNGSSTVTLRDAYVKWRFYEGIHGKIGRFKEALLRSAIVSDNRLLFLDRTFLGELLDRRDLGVEIGGSFDVVNWAVQAQDGSDGQGEEHRFTARLSANVIGKAGNSKNEGAYGAGDETNVNVGVAFQDEGSLEDGQIITADVALTAGPLCVAAEIADFDEGDGVTTGGFDLDLIGFGAGADPADTTPWDVTVSYLITPEWEVGGRYEDLDNDDDTTSWTLGANHYVRGHDIKWSGQWKQVKSDSSDDVDQLGLGVGVSF